MSLDDAYRAALYVAGDVVIRVGEPVPLATEWAFVSACNPGSVKQSRNANKRRHRALSAALDRAGHRDVTEGEARAPDGTWRERSVLIRGIARADAIALGRRFGQRAIVVGRAHDVAELVWL